MILREAQRDALTELLNIAFGRAAASLSKLTGHRVMLEVPSVEIHPIAALNAALARVIHGEVASVHQVFSGAVAGDALLVLDAAGASLLTELLTSEPALPLPLDASAQEVVTELGNVLLNACLGMFGNLLKVHVTFSVPRLTLEALASVVDSISVGHEELRYAIVVHAAFRLRDSAVTGYLVIVLGIASLDQLLKAVETWREESEAR